MRLKVCIHHFFVAPIMLCYSILYCIVSCCAELCCVVWLVLYILYLLQVYAACAEGARNPQLEAALAEMVNEGYDIITHKNDVHTHIHV